MADSPYDSGAAEQESMNANENYLTRLAATQRTATRPISMSQSDFVRNYPGVSPDVAAIKQALNEIGASPRDIIAIFQALRRAGALRAELVVI